MMIKKYIGTALHPSLGERERASGEIWFSGAKLVFSNENIRKELPLSGIKIEMVKAGITLFYFSHSLEQEWSFYTSDKSILKDDALQANQAIKTIQGKVLNKKIITYVTMSIILLAIISLFAFGSTIKNSLVATLADRVPVEWEAKLGEVAFNSVNFSMKIQNDEKAMEQINKLTEPLLANIEDKRYSFKFYIAHEKFVNAFALPGGHVVLSTGLIEFVQTPEEILGIISHEIAHVQNRHSVKQMINSLGLYSLVQFFFGDMTGLGAILIDNGSFLVTQSYSREFETDADITGLNYLVKAKINPDGLVQFLERINKRGFMGDGSQSAEVERTIEKINKVAEKFEILSSHPNSNERMRYLRAEIEKLPYELKNQRLDFDLKALKDALSVEMSEKN